MASNEVLKDGNTNSFTFPALVLGVTNAAVALPVVAGFQVGSSEPVALVRTIPGGVPGIPRMGLITASNAAGAPSATISLASSVNTDTSVYTLYWKNKSPVGASSVAGTAAGLIFPC
jgi:hypothetical protein